ncbi:MAG: exosortase system-associated protein, TIGR04073 family [Candidatus Hydrogenedentes bacterium]|nr:exosortase system-associated protein, TIGR04073 family [Candidatus Hydrogenedentota bacterium]
MKLRRVSPRAKQFIGLVMVVVLLSSALPAYAQYEVEKKDYPGKRQLTKLGRGLANIFSGWAEIPKEIHTQGKTSQKLASVIFAAPVIGIAKMFARMTVGVFETVTFFLPIPEDYAPIIEPEYVF